MLRLSSQSLLRSSACRLSRTHAHAPKALLSCNNNNNNNSTTNNVSVAFSTQAGANSATMEAAKCPFTGKTSSGSQRDLSTVEVTLQDMEVLPKVHPELKDVPNVPVLGIFVNAIPFIGKFLNDHIYKNPTMGPDNAYEFQYTLYEKYGTFYSTYIPGLGEGLYPKVYMIMDPEEMKKVIRQEGSFPRGGVEGLKPMTKWMKKNNFAIAGGAENENDAGFMGRGDTWRRIRTFLQTDLLSPKSANGYVPGVASAAKIASRGANESKNDMNAFLNHAAFDMFQTIMFGQLSKLTDNTTPSDPIDVEFCQLSVDSLAFLIHMQNDQNELIKFNMGLETETYQKFEEAMDGLKAIVMQKLDTFKKRMDRGELDENERNSYFAHAIQRQREEGSNVDEEELMQICLLMLNASVDTTATFISWAMVHLSTNPDVQEKLYQELKHHADSTNDGVLTSGMLTKSKSPYLHAVLRESHRMTPVHPTTMFKSNSAADIELHGVTIPKGSIVGFDAFSLGMDPKVVHDPETFLPERWMNDEEIEKRKGTPAEALDSIFFRDPFSQGARRCPGSRVAVNETQLLLSQLVLDWKMTVPESVSSYKDIPYRMQTLLVPQLPEMGMEARV